MPSLLADDPAIAALIRPGSNIKRGDDTRQRTPTENQDGRAGDGEVTVNGEAVRMNGRLTNGETDNKETAGLEPNGVLEEPEGKRGREQSRERLPVPSSKFAQYEVPEQKDESHGPAVNGRRVSSDEGEFASAEGRHVKEQNARLCGNTSVSLTAADVPDGDGAVETKQSLESSTTNAPSTADVDSSPTMPAATEVPLRAPAGIQRASSPPAFQTPRSLTPTSTMQSAPGQQPPRLQQRHTLEVPRLSTTSRLSREYTSPTNPDDVASATGRFSPNTPTRRRGSMSLVRRATRSIASDLHLDEVPQDDDAARWAEHIRQKRASKRKRKDDEDDDRVVVGTKVDQNHVNWVTAYNMLTGIRFTVSRTNAKMDRELTDADFDARHKFSFDITGNELTPSAKYDFKFKDYAPWVFRHLRAIFKLDPADYLMSLTSKYILSELGSPGKSGSFFYFSRDYKYIIKTIHHAEHKFLRKILKDYYYHVKENPNTLLSQFYGLHRVKIPYGRKIHFVVMNNLFPPHRDIHRTFDLKGSTIGRDFREDDLENNPRATLKDLNWLRRNLHLEFGPVKKRAFVEQMERDVHLLQRLKIMDYSLLVGIHDLERGNEDKLRDKTLQVFQPGGEDATDLTAHSQSNMLARTPSKMEKARIRQMIKSQRPIPMELAKSGMPDELEAEVSKRGFYFYSDDGGFRATHEDERPGEEIYYLGIIDCLTHYGFVKRAEHFWKGLSNNESQISAIPPERYGDRFVRFICGIAKTREAAELEKAEERGVMSTDVLDDPQLTGINVHASQMPSNQISPRDPDKTDRVMERAEKEAERSKHRGSNENAVPSKVLTAARSSSVERAEGGGYTLPVVEEDVEGQSTGGKSGRSARSADPSPSLHPQQRGNEDLEKRLSSRLLPPLQDPSPGNAADEAEESRPPTSPPKEDGPSMPPSLSSVNRPPTPQSQTQSPRRRADAGADGAGPGGSERPYTPPSDSVVSRGRSPNRDKALPPPPQSPRSDYVDAEDGMLRPFDAS